MHVKRAIYLLVFGSIDSFTTPTSKIRAQSGIEPAYTLKTEKNQVFTIREANDSDVGKVNNYLKQLRSFHSGLSQNDAAQQKKSIPLIKIGTTIQSLMPQVRNCHVLLIYSSMYGIDISNEPIGMASYHLKYTGFGSPLMHMEHLFVSPLLRSQGAGLALMNELARVGKKLHCSHIEWSVQKENVRGIKFYIRIGADVMDNNTNEVFGGNPPPASTCSLKSFGESNTMMWIPSSWSL